MTCLYLTSLMPQVNYFLKTSSYESEPLIGDNATFHSGNPSLSHHLRSLVDDSFGLFGSVCFGWTRLCAHEGVQFAADSCSSVAYIFQRMLPIWESRMSGPDGLGRRRCQSQTIW